MSLGVTLFDVVLVLTLIGVAARILTAPDLFQGIVFFVVFGLLMSLAWIRLQAVDVALAEAAIGAGLTGALFLSTLSRTDTGPQRGGGRQSSALLVVRLPIVLLSLALAGMLGRIVLSLSREPAGLGELVEAEIQRSGVSNPVTAVLLNFRAYDTLLEVAVLLLAVMGVWSLGLGSRPRSGADAGRPDSALGAAHEPSAGPVLLAFTRVLTPLIGVVAGYLLWVGAQGPGGAFQSGAVLCAAGVLLLVTGIARRPALRRWPHRALLVLGFAAFLIVAAGVMTRGYRFFEYPPDAAGGLILLIEGLLAVSIAIVLVALFAGGESEEAPSIPSHSN